MPVASVPAPAVHAEAVPAAKSTRADGVSMVVTGNRARVDLDGGKTA